jgi:MoaA/NifB/PqqE/SkfB family radical SAM enzyme
MSAMSTPEWLVPAVEIPVTEACNNRCSFCTTAWSMTEKSFEPSDLSRETMRERLAEAYARGSRRVIFHGGEPTRRRDLGEIVEDARRAGYELVSIFTHARAAATEEGARWLTTMGVTSFMVSIQGGTAEAHDAAVGVPGAFVETVGGTRRLLALGQRVKVNGVLTRHLLDTLDAYARLMLELGPEEVGLDTIKPTGAFDRGRASYAELCPRLSPYAGALGDALVAMERGGVTARLTSFPPCLVPGAEHLVNEEPATVTSIKPIGKVFDKMVWRRDMQVKAPACARCAYDGLCGGVYVAYAEAYGLDELRPVERRRAPLAAPEPVPEAPLTRALRALFVRPLVRRARFGIREVRRHEDGSHELRCFGPNGDLTILLARSGASPSYATTARFGVRYGGEPDLRFVDAVVAQLRRVEGQLPAD